MTESITIHVPGLCAKRNSNFRRWAQGFAENALRKLKMDPPKWDTVNVEIVYTNPRFDLKPLDLLADVEGMRDAGVMSKACKPRFLPVRTLYDPTNPNPLVEITVSQPS